MLYNWDWHDCCFVLQLDVIHHVHMYSDNWSLQTIVGQGIEAILGLNYASSWMLLFIYFKIPQAFL